MVEVSAGTASPVTLAGLLDTGSLFTVLPDTVAPVLGLRPSRRLRVSVGVGGWRGKPVVVHGLTLRLRGPDVDGGGREAVVEVRCPRVLLVPSPYLSGLALLGQEGFLDGVESVLVNQRKNFSEVLSA